MSAMNAYMVEGIKGSKRVYTITPKETWNCPSTGTCYHLLAIKLGFIKLNSTTDVNKTIKNLTLLLRKNIHPRVAKEGQKKT